MSWLTTLTKKETRKSNYCFSNKLVPTSDSWRVLSKQRIIITSHFRNTVGKNSGNFQRKFPGKSFLEIFGNFLLTVRRFSWQLADVWFRLRLACSFELFETTHQRVFIAVAKNSSVVKHYWLPSNRTNAFRTRWGPERQLWWSNFCNTVTSASGVLRNRGFHFCGKSTGNTLLFHRRFDAERKRL